MVETHMPFGKHRGEPLSQIPSGYLAWCLAECSSLKRHLRYAIECELADRDNARSRQQPESRGPGRQDVALALNAIAQAWYREMSLRFHPDRGGCDEAMRAINVGAERLRELIEAAA